VAQSVKTGSSVTFSVQAGGSGPLRYLWRLDGTPIPGANAGSYTRAGVDSTSAGNYSVQVTNLYGSVFSGNATLTVLSVLPLKFDLISILSLGEVKLVLSGEPGTYTIEGSTNLAQWNLVTNVTLGSTPLEFIAGSASNAPAIFYRATPAAP
jgi:hypothetical protein